LAHVCICHLRATIGLATYDIREVSADQQLTPVTTQASALSARQWTPRRARTADQLDIQPAVVSDLLLKTLYQSSPLAGYELSQRLRLDYHIFSGLLEELVSQGQVQKLGDAPRRPAHLSSLDEGFNYGITSTGVERAREATARNAYVGVAPVPLDTYTLSVVQQALPEGFASPERLENALRNLVLPRTTLKLLGPALNSRSSIFLYGHSGNGKSTIARATRDLLGGGMYIPYAVAIEDQVIRLLDRGYHEPLGNADPGADQRWLYCRRPLVAVGGELDNTMLDLIWHPDARFYDAPLQMKANGGVFLVDDLGRQVTDPRTLLNRFIIPMEEDIDYLNMTASGRKIDVPFGVLLIFSTNIQPKELVDEAFLRRIRHKVRIDDPSEEAFKEIFRREAELQHVAINDAWIDYILKLTYKGTNPPRPMRGVHPRDLLTHIREIAEFEGVRDVVINAELVDAACAAQFVDEL
jgi:predicted ATPase with chaperone activity